MRLLSWEFDVNRIEKGLYGSLRLFFGLDALVLALLMWFYGMSLM